MITRLEEEGLPVVAVCHFRGVNRAGYYAHAQGDVGLREQDDARLRPLVRQIFWEHKRRYGARRIAVELTARGETCGPGRVSRLLKQLGLQAIQPRSFRPRTTQSRHPLGYSPNLLLHVPPPSRINESCFGTIKTELEMEVSADVRIARGEIRAYLCYDDTKRCHSSLNYRTPCEFEQCQQ